MFRARESEVRGRSTEYVPTDGGIQRFVRLRMLGIGTTHEELLLQIRTHVDIVGFAWRHEHAARINGDVGR